MEYKSLAAFRKQADAALLAYVGLPENVSCEIELLIFDEEITRIDMMDTTEKNPQALFSM